MNYETWCQVCLKYVLETTSGHNCEGIVKPPPQVKEPGERFKELKNIYEDMENLAVEIGKASGMGFQGYKDQKSPSDGVVLVKTDERSGVPAIYIGPKTDDPYWSNAEEYIPKSQLQVALEALEEISSRNDNEFAMQDIAKKAIKNIKGKNGLEK